MLSEGRSHHLCRMLLRVQIKEGSMVLEVTLMTLMRPVCTGWPNWRGWRESGWQNGDSDVAPSLLLNTHSLVSAVCWRPPWLTPSCLVFLTTQSHSPYGSKHPLIWSISHPNSPALILHHLELMSHHQQIPLHSFPFSGFFRHLLILGPFSPFIYSCLLWWLLSLPHYLVLRSLEVGVCLLLIAASKPSFHPSFLKVPALGLMSSDNAIYSFFAVIYRPQVTSLWKILAPGLMPFFPIFLMWAILGDFSILLDDAFYTLAFWFCNCFWILAFEFLNLFSPVILPPCFLSSSLP